MKDSAILLIVIICSLTISSFEKNTKKHPILQRQSFINMKVNQVTPAIGITSNANGATSTNSEEPAKEAEEISITDDTSSDTKTIKPAIVPVVPTPIPEPTPDPIPTPIPEPTPDPIPTPIPKPKPYTSRTLGKRCNIFRPCVKGERCRFVGFLKRRCVK